MEPKIFWVRTADRGAAERFDSKHFRPTAAALILMGVRRGATAAEAIKEIQDAASRLEVNFVQKINMVFL
jgi:hypothetical protein